MGPKETSVGLKSAAFTPKKKKGKSIVVDEEDRFFFLCCNTTISFSKGEEKRQEVGYISKQTVC